MTTFNYTVSDKDYTPQVCRVSFSPIPLKALMIKSRDGKWVADISRYEEGGNVEWRPFRTVEGVSWQDAYERVLEVVQSEIKMWMSELARIQLSFQNAERTSPF